MRGVSEPGICGIEFGFQEVIYQRTLAYEMRHGCRLSGSVGLPVFYEGLQVRRW